jgi:hypothetical protein
LVHSSQIDAWHSIHVCEPTYCAAGECAGEELPQDHMSQVVNVAKQKTDVVLMMRTMTS